MTSTCATTPAVGFPAHRLVVAREWKNRDNELVTDWTAACGSTHRQLGRLPSLVVGDVCDDDLCLHGCWARGTSCVYPEPTYENG